MKEDQEVEENDEIYEEYRLWKKNSPITYDTLITQSLDWPSLTIDWLSEKSINSTSEFMTHRLVLGTHTSSQEQNYLIIATVKIPLEGSLGHFEAEKDSYMSKLGFKIEPQIWIEHPTEVNKARGMPQKPNIIASKPASSEVLIYDFHKHPCKSSLGPQLFLQGHTDQGFALGWNSIREGMLASGGSDCLVCFWDLNAASNQPLSAFKKHTLEVNDLSWSPFNEQLIASVSDDTELIIWDLRQAQHALTTKASNFNVNSVDFNKVDACLIATADSEGKVGIWDTRLLNSMICSLDFHKDAVYTARWGNTETLIATGSCDRRVLIWDLSRIGQADTDLPELAFEHRGHTARVNDLAWNMSENCMMGSVDADNNVHVWQIASGFINH